MASERDGGDWSDVSDSDVSDLSSDDEVSGEIWRSGLGAPRPPSLPSRGPANLTSAGDLRSTQARRRPSSRPIGARAGYPPAH